MTTKLVLDCESFDSALQSLAQAFQTSPASLRAFLSLKEIGEFFERDWRQLPDFKEYIRLIVERQFGAPLPLDEVCWFHTTRVLPGTTFVEGILPLNAALPRLKQVLVDAVEDEQLKANLRTALADGAIADQHYYNKTQNSMHWGPYGILVRDVAFNTDRLCQHDYLGMPEIIEDICNGISQEGESKLIDVFTEKLRPTVVKFTDTATYDASYTGTALCYVYSVIHTGRPCMNSVYCFDGEGTAVPSQNILKVEVVEVAKAPS